MDSGAEGGLSVLVGGQIAVKIDCMLDITRQQSP
jgi:hypothetical protein